MRDWDVIVIGGGPAGAVAAARLSRLGCAVLVVERATFPRDKVCGGCLNQRALAALREAGLMDVVGSLDAPQLDMLALRGYGAAAQIDLPTGIGVSRRALDAALLKEAERLGVRVVHGRAGRVGRVSNGSRALVVGDGADAQTYRARVCVFASGLASPNTFEDIGGLSVSIDETSRIGAGAHLPKEAHDYRAGTIHMAVGDHGYVGAAVVEEGALNIAAAIDAGFVKNRGGLANACAEILQGAGFPLPCGMLDVRWRGTPPLSRSLSAVRGERLLVIGDAGGYMEPFTGEGMAWAMSSGLAAAQIIDTNLSSWSPEAERAWSAWHRHNVAKPQKRCRLVARALRSRAFTQAGIRALHWMPLLAKPALHFINAPAQHRSRGMRWA